MGSRYMQMGSGEGSTEWNLIVCTFHLIYAVRVVKSRRLRQAGHVARMEEGTNAFKILTYKPTENRSLGRPRRRCEDNIRMYLKEMDINMRNWIDSAQDRDYWGALVNMALNLQVPLTLEL